MANDDPQRSDPHRVVHIEIEDGHLPEFEPESELLTSRSSRPGAALAIIVLALGSLVAVLWFSSPSESAAEGVDRDEPLAQDLDADFDGESDSISNGRVDATDSFLVEPAVLDPMRLDVRLSDVISIDGRLIALTPSGAQQTPPVLTSDDGVTWDDVDTRVEGPESTTEYFWRGVRSVGGELVIARTDVDNATDYFVSSDGATWLLHDEQTPPTDDSMGIEDGVFFLVSAVTGERRTWELPPALVGGDDSDAPRVMGKVSVRFLNRYLFEGDAGLWILDPNTGTWEQISADVTGHRNLEAAPSSQRLASVNGGELTVVHVFEASSRLGLSSCTYALTGVAPIDQLETTILATTEQQVIFASPTGTWSTEMPAADSTCDRWIENSRPTTANLVVAPRLTQGSVVLFDGVLIALVAPSSLASAPPLFQSTDGVDWSPIETSVLINGDPSTAPHRWRRLRVTGAGISLIGLSSVFDESDFVATNGGEWVSATSEVQSVDPLQSFSNTRSVTEESIIGNFSILRGPDDLDIDDDIEPALVRECLRDLGEPFFTPQLVLAEFDRERRELSQVALRDAVAVDTLALADGRVVGVGKKVAVFQPPTCRDVVRVPSVGSEFLFVLDPENDSVTEWPLHPELAGAERLRVLGEVVTGPLRRFILTTPDELWAFDVAIQEWTSLGPGPGRDGSSVLSSAGQNLYSLDGDTLRRWSFFEVRSDIGTHVCSWGLPQDDIAPDDQIGRRLVFASHDFIGYATAFATWLIDNTETSLPWVVDDCSFHLEEPIGPPGS